MIARHPSLPLHFSDCNSFPRRHGAGPCLAISLAPLPEFPPQARGRGSLSAKPSIGRSATLQSAEMKRYDQPMSEPPFYPRHVERRLAEALEDSPVVLIHGPRQCGKTTLAQFAYAPQYLRWGDDYLTWGDDRFSWGVSRQHRDYTYISFDDAVARDGARADPMGFVADLPERVILDEIQRAP